MTSFNSHSIDADIQAVNRRIDKIFREYGADSHIYKEATKFLRGADAPRTYKSKSGAVHISRTKRPQGGAFGRQVKKIREGIPSDRELKHYGKTTIERESFAERYDYAKSQIDSKMGEWYRREDQGRLSPREEEIWGEAKEIMRHQYNSKQEIVQVVEMLDESFDWE